MTRTNQTALMVIDMQVVAFDGIVTPPINQGLALLNRIEVLIASCRAIGYQIIYIQTRAASGYPYAEDVHGWELHPQLTPQPDDLVVYKTGSSGFDATDLQNVLDAHKLKTLVVCGIWSQHCVANTALDGVRLGYDVHIVEDGHATVADTDAEASRIVDEQNRRLAENGVGIAAVNQLPGG